MVERTLARLLGYRGLVVRYEHRADLLLGLLQPAHGLKCLGFLDPAAGS